MYICNTQEIAGKTEHNIKVQTTFLSGTSGYIVRS